jgi:hypothetical protein
VKLFQIIIFGVVKSVEEMFVVSRIRRALVGYDLIPGPMFDIVDLFVEGLALLDGRKREQEPTGNGSHDER